MNIFLNSSWGVILFNGLLAFHIAILIGSALLIWQKSRLRHPGKQRSNEIENTTQSQERISWTLLVILSVVAIFLRIWHLDSDLWHDEVVTLVEYVRPPLAQIMSSFQSQNQHMFYSVLGHLAIDIFGESAWALRIPAVLFGVMGLWAVYLLGQRLLGSREALFAFALMTISYHHIWFSQNARGYTGLMFFATLSTWLYLKALKQNRWREWLLYIAAVVLGMWTHLTMAFVIASQVLVWSFLFFKGSDGRPEWRKPLAAFLLSVTLTLQLYALSLPEFFAVALHKGSLKSEWTNPIWMIAESIRGLRIGFLSIPFVLIGGCLPFVGWRNIFRRDPIAAILLVLPAFLGGFTMLVLGHNLWPRFFFFSMGFGVLILVSGAMDFPRIVVKKFSKIKFREKLANRAGIVLISIVILVSLFGVPRCYTLPKQDFTGARDFVEQNIASGDLVVAVGLAGFNYQSYYAPDWCRGNTKESINELLETGKVLWLVYTLPIQLKAYQPEIWEMVQNEFEIIKSFPGTLGGGQVVVCRNKSSTQTSI